MSVDGTPISQADVARIKAEEDLHAEQQRKAVRVLATASTDAQDCRMLLSMLGLGDDVIAAARSEIAGTPPAKRARKRHAA